MLYFDHAATTPLTKRALLRLQDSYGVDFANPASPHQLGRDLSAKMDHSREKILSLLNASKERWVVVFTSSATESNNTIVNGLNLNKGDCVAFAEGDHPSIVVPCRTLRKSSDENEIRLIKMPMKNGRILEEETLNLLKDLPSSNSLALICLTYVNSQSGSILDIHHFASQIKKIKSGIHIHIDAVQGVGKLPFSLEDPLGNEVPFDSVSISAHKIGGPKGIAALLLRTGVAASLRPLLQGGGHEGNLRASTPAAPLIFSFQEAMEEAFESLNTNFNKAVEISTYLRNEIIKSFPGAFFPFENLQSSPFIIPFVIPALPGDVVVRHLEQQQVFISTTSACSSKISALNPTLAALGLKPQFHRHILRLSFSPFTTPSEAQDFCLHLSEAYKKLKIFIKQ